MAAHAIHPAKADAIHAGRDIPIAPAATQTTVCTPTVRKQIGIATQPRRRSMSIAFVVFSEWTRDQILCGKPPEGFLAFMAR